MRRQVGSELSRSFAVFSAKLSERGTRFFLHGLGRTPGLVHELDAPASSARKLARQGAHVLRCEALKVSHRYAPFRLEDVLQLLPRSLAREIASTPRGRPVAKDRPRSASFVLC
jgi:hypothetical protein